MSSFNLSVITSTGLQKATINVRAMSEVPMSAAVFWMKTDTLGP